MQSKLFSPIKRKAGKILISSMCKKVIVTGKGVIEAPFE